MGENRIGNMNTLQEMILDEERLVTYVSLSKELCVHINESKILLHQAVDNIRDKKPNIDLNIQYIVSGLLDNGIAKTVVCIEPELDALKESFKVIFFEHVYSVSKGCPHINRASLLATTKTEDLILCTGIIKSNNCVKRTVDEIVTLKSNSQNLILLSEDRTIDQSLKKLKKECEVKLSNEREKKRDDLNTDDNSNKIKLVNNVKIEKSSPKKDLNNKQKVNLTAVKQKGIAGFFNKTNGPSSKKENINEDRKPQTNSFKKIIKDETKIKDMVRDVKVKNKELTDIKNEEVVKAQKTVQNEIIVKEINKSETITKKNLKVDKKRKRVLSVPQSDSETEENDPFISEEQVDIQNESEDEIPPTPTINTIKITSGIQNPKKKRKIVEKTYTSDDGYILTKKEEVYESCSDNDEEVVCKENVESVNKPKVETSPKVNINGTQKSKKKASPPQKGKQATMFNFFKREKN